MTNNKTSRYKYHKYHAVSARRKHKIDTILSRYISSRDVRNIILDYYKPIIVQYSVHKTKFIPDMINSHLFTPREYSNMVYVNSKSNEGNLMLRYNSSHSQDIRTVLRANYAKLPFHYGTDQYIVFRTYHPKLHYYPMFWKYSDESNINYTNVNLNTTCFRCKLHMYMYS